jgi:hypothetical protein
MRAGARAIAAALAMASVSFAAVAQTVPPAAQIPSGAQLVPPRAFLHREPIVALAARHRLPAVYAYRSQVMSGGLTPLTRSTTSGARPATSIASSRVRSRVTCRCRRRPNTSS